MNTGLSIDILAQAHFKKHESTAYDLPNAAIAFDCSEYRLLNSVMFAKNVTVVI